MISENITIQSNGCTFLDCIEIRKTIKWTISNKTNHPYNAMNVYLVSGQLFSQQLTIQLRQLIGSKLKPEL